MTSAAMLAVNFRGVGLTIAFITVAGFIIVWIRNIQKAKPELGSEIELAPNRKPYLSDEELEGEKLDRSLGFALVLLTLLALIIPFYWLAEPGRQDGAVAAYQRSFESRGEGTYTVGAQCVNCHAAGGSGGVAPYVLQDVDGQFIANVSWKAPALNNVLQRYSDDEVRYILNYGRPGSPMAAWGTPGGGPLTTQQIDNVIEYLRTFQVQSIDPVDIAAAGGDDAYDEESLAAQEAADKLTADIMTEVQRSLDEGEFKTIGEAVFNLGLYSGFQSGASSCGRCHTAGWSIQADNVLEEGVAACGGGHPSGIGYNLCAEDTLHRFPNDTWLQPDGSWYRMADSSPTRTTPEPGSPEGYDRTYVLAQDGTRIALDDKGNPITADGEPYLVLTATEDRPDQDGDLAQCDYVSQLWAYTGVQETLDEATAFGTEYELNLGDDYAWDMAGTLSVNADGVFKDPPRVYPEDVAPDAFYLPDERVVGNCTIIDMPARTSQAHYDFIANGAEAGTGYGEGGMSGAGMMPGFGKLLPPELIEEVVNYERGL